MLMVNAIPSIVRVLSRAHDVGAGTGFLVTSRHVATCAHVLERALDMVGDPAQYADAITWQAPGAPAGQIPDAPPDLGGERFVVEFPSTGARVSCTVRVWWPSHRAAGADRDVAILELADAAPAQPLSLLDLAEPWDVRCRVFGFPAGRPEGSYAEGRLRDVVANGWVLLRGEADAREFVRPGFSGAPVLREDGRVLGMLSAGTPGQRDALMIPARALRHALPSTFDAEIAPYPGLQVFGAEHARFFFGRERDLIELETKLETHPLLALTGPSGSGKSSLLHAGLAPRMRSRGWSVAIIAPGRDPDAALGRALAAAWFPPGTERLLEARRIADAIRSGTLTLQEVAREALAEGSSGLLAIFDQVEEALAEEDSAAALWAQVQALSHPRARTVLGVRADFLEPLANTAPAGAPRPELLYLGGVPDLRAVIEAPLEALGWGRFEPGLVARLLADVREQANPLPLLQFTLRELWGRREDDLLTHAAYEGTGGVAAALSRHAERVWEALPEGKRVQARSVLEQCVRPTDHGYARRTAHPDDLPAGASGVAGTLADARLVTLGDGGVVTLAHEALVRHWPRLRAWLEESDRFRRFQERLRTDLDAFEARGGHEDLLLRGVRLAEAEEHLPRLPEREAGFVRRSLAARAREEDREAARIRREGHLRRGLTGSLALLAILALLAAAGGLELWRRAEERAAAAVEAQARAEAQANVARAARLGAQALLATRAPSAAAGDPAAGAAMALEAAELDPEGAAGVLLSVVQANPRYRARLPLEAAPVAVAFAGGRVRVVSGDARLIELDSAGGAAREVRLAPYRPPEGGRGFTPDATAAAFGSAGGVIVGFRDGTLRRYEPDGTEAARAWTGESPTHLAVSADGRWLASAGLGAGTSLRIWRLPDLELRHELPRPHYRAIAALAFAPEGALLASGASDGTLALWDAERGERRAFSTARSLGLGVGHPDVLGHPVDPYHPDVGVGALAFSPDGRHLARGGTDGSVLLIDTATLTPTGAPPAPQEGPVTALAFHADGEALAIGGEAGALRDVSLESLAVTPLEGQLTAVRALAFDGDELLSAGEDGLIVWEPSATHAGETIHAGPRVDGLLLSPDGRTLAIASRDRAVYLYDTSTWELRARLTGADVTWRTLGVSGSGERLVASGSYEFQVWDTATGDPLTPLLESPAPIWSLAFDGGDTVLVSHAEGVDRWSASTGEIIEREAGIVHLGGRRYELSGEGLRDPEGRFVPDTSVLTLAYDPVHDLYAYGDGGAVVLWDPDAQQVSGVLRGHTDGAVRTLAFSPDGTRLASGANDNRIILWDAASGRAIGGALEGHDAQIATLLFLPPGGALLSGGQDGKAIAWPANEEAWRGALQRRAGEGP